MADAPYDPYVPKDGGEGRSRTDQLQDEINKTVKVMQNNIESVADRGARLNELQGKTDQLAESSMQFRRGANQVRKKMWWKDMKMRMWIIIGIVVLLVIIIVPAVVTTRH